MDTHDKNREATKKPSREARLSAVVYAIRGHIENTSLSDAECVAKIELELLDVDAVSLGGLNHKECGG